MERLIYISFLLIITGPMVTGQTEQPSPCNPSACQNGGSCQVINNSPFYQCNCQLGYRGYDCAQDPRNLGIQQPFIFLPLLFVGALQQVKIREIPGIPIILDILQDMLIEFTPCAASCLIDGSILMEIYNDVMYMNGTYITCVMGTVSQIINLTSTEDVSNFFVDKSRLCPVLDEASECIANELERTCGSGLRNMLDRIYQKTDIFDCSPQNQNNPLNIYACSVEPFIRLTNNVNASLLDSIATCLNAQRFASSGSWGTIFGQEENSGFPTVCGFVRDVGDCVVNNLRLFRNNSADCDQFERTIYENLNSMLEFANCSSNGTAALRCLADPELLGYLVGSGQSVAFKRRKRQAAPILVHCLDIWTDGDLGSRIQTAVPDLQADFEAGNIQAIAEAVAKETCGDVSRFVECIVDNAFPGKPSCNFITRGLGAVAAPILEAYNTLGQCGRLILDTDQRNAVNNCSCLSGFPTRPLGTCGLRDIIQNIVFTLVIRRPWNDSLADKPCSEIGYLNIICQELELILGNNLGIAVQFLGIAPNDDDEIALLYEAEVPMSQLKTIESALETLVMPERVKTVKVSTDVNVKQVVNGELIINDTQPRKGAMAGGTPVTITGYFLENIALVTIGDIDCALKIRSPVVYICITGALLDSSLVNKPLDVKSAAKDFGLQFSYLPDPIITSVHPLKSIVTGGASLTVDGAYFDSVVITTMLTTVTSLDTRRSYMTPTECSIRSSTQLICPTAPIVLNRLVKKRKRRQAPVSVNTEENIEVRIAFELDGVEEYRNLTGTNLEEFSQLTIYADPVIKNLQPAILTFRSTWPVEDKYIEIKGEDLLVGLQKEEYVVRIGDAICSNVVVHDNLIVCEPPKTRPNVAAEDDVGYNKIPVKLLYASRDANLGHLSYIQNLWEYPPGRYGIIGALCGFVVIIILIVVCCLYKRRQSTQHSGTPEKYLSAQEHLNLAQRVKRWSRKSPKRFSSFIPSGQRAQTNYAPSSYDGGHTGKHQPYWDHY